MRPAGHWVVMKATISDVDLFIMVNSYSNKHVACFVSMCVTTVCHQIDYCSYLVPELIILFMSSYLSRTSTTRHNNVLWHLKISGQQNVVGMH